MRAGRGTLTACWPEGSGLLKMVSALQAQIYCQRYEDAAEAANSLLDGPDKQYLRAELLWRQGRVQEAILALGSASSEKAVDLRARLELLLRAVAAADQCYEDGTFDIAMHPIAALIQNSSSAPCRALPGWHRGMQLRAGQCPRRGVS